MHRKYSKNRESDKIFYCFWQLRWASSVDILSRLKPGRVCQLQMFILINKYCSKMFSLLNRFAREFSLTLAWRS